MLRFYPRTLRRIRPLLPALILLLVVSIAGLTSACGGGNRNSRVATTAPPPAPVPAPPAATSTLRVMVDAATCAGRVLNVEILVDGVSIDSVPQPGGSVAATVSVGAHTVSAASSNGVTWPPATLEIGTAGLVYSLTCTPPSPVSPAPPAALPSATTADLAYCVQETNRYRALVHLGGLSQSAALEDYAAMGARIDGTSHSAHSHFLSTNGGGIAFAENEIPWWRFAPYLTVRAVIQQGLVQFWAEGPTGGHRKNLTGPYTQVGCGVFISNGEITVVQDFR